MIPLSPADAFGQHTTGLRDLLIEVIRARHGLAAEAHQVSASRYAAGFGTQWRDLQDDTRDALRDRGFRTCKLAPGGHEIPVVNDSLVYVWRIPNTSNAVSKFASSPTRKNGFMAAPLDPTLWEPSLTDDDEPVDDDPGEGEINSVLAAVGTAMPLVLVMIESSPRQLQSIEWAVATLDDGKVTLHGQESIWVPEIVTDAATSDVESFDSGTPDGPTIEPREQDGSQPDA